MNKVDKVSSLRTQLAQLISDNMGDESGRLFADFYQYDDENSIIEGARSLLAVMFGQEVADKKVEEVMESYEK